MQKIERLESSLFLAFYPANQKRKTVLFQLKNEKGLKRLKAFGPKKCVLFNYFLK